uniref:Uncharacterized protein n=1 Tax=Arundo donax TaxID=35708 RepID=A0A0A9AVD4_ARUDO
MAGWCDGNGAVDWVP